MASLPSEPSGLTSSALADVSARRTEAPAKHALASSVGDRRSLGYVAVSLAAHLLRGVATEESPEVPVRIEPKKPIGARFANVVAVVGEPTPWEIGDSPDYDVDGGGQPTMGLEGKAGGETKETGHARLAKGPIPAVTTKQQAIEAARTGILGSTAAIASSVGHLTSTADESAGFDAIDVQGPLYGGTGERRGSFGLGRTGFGDSAGCRANCNALRHDRERQCDGQLRFLRYARRRNLDPQQVIAHEPAVLKVNG